MKRLFGPKFFLYSPQRSVGSAPRKITLPKKKARDELSVLKVLAGTVNNDPTAPSFRYIDDPFLIPGSQLEKRTYSLAKASGKKAAHYAMKTLPEFFVHRPMDHYTDTLPKAFEPRFVPKQQKDTLGGLEERIQMRLVISACESYHALKDNGDEIPLAMKQDLLALCCFYNCEEPEHELYEDEAFFETDVLRDRSKTTRKTWKDNGFAETLFKEIGKEDAIACSAIVKGRAKYFQVDKAYDLFQEMKEEGKAIDVEVYDAIFSICSFLRDSPQARQELILDLLKQMYASGVHPTLKTFNYILAMWARSSLFENSPKYSMEVIQEMKRCGIEPSLGSWTLVLRTYYPKELQTSCNILQQIITYLDGKEFEARHELDYEFFVTAMGINHEVVQDLSLAYKIDKLLNYGDNINLLGDAAKEGSYYSNFLRLLCTFEQIDAIMEVYDRITPHAYTPTFGAYQELLTAVQLNDGYKYIPQIWSDFVLFNYSRRSDLVEKLLLLISKRKYEDSLQELFTNIATRIFTQFEEDKADLMVRRPFNLTGVMFGHLAQVLLHSDNQETAWKIFNIYLHSRNTTEKFPTEESLVMLADSAMQMNDVDKCVHIVEVMADLAYPKADAVVVKATELFTNEEDKQRLHSALQG